MRTKTSTDITFFIRTVFLAFGALFFFFISAKAEPVIFWANDPVGPGDTVLISGSGLETLTDIRLRKISSGHSAVNAWTSVTAIQKNPESVKFKIPQYFSSGIYQVELVAPDGLASRMLNTPSVYWVQGDAGRNATPAGWIRVMGRNIARAPGAQLELKLKKTSSVIWLHAQDTASLWNAEFTLPEKIAVGNYQLLLWNGQGEKKFEPCGEIQIREKFHFPDARVNVRDFGAHGNGRADDTAAVKAALETIARMGGGTVFFPRGSYLLKDGISVPDNTILLGEARNLVSLDWEVFDQPPAALIDGYRNFSIRDLSLFAANYRTVIRGGFAIGRRTPERASPENIEIRNVLVRASAFYGHPTAQQAMEREIAGTKPHTLINAPVALQLTGKNLRVTGSDFYSSGGAFFLLHPKNVYIAHNTFFNGIGWYSITGADGVIFEYNKIRGADLRSMGGGLNTLCPDCSFSQNVLFQQNSFARFFGWDRESVTSDGPGGYYYGAARSASRQTVLLTGAISLAGSGLPKPSILHSSWEGAGLFVLGGKGAGEYGTIQNHDGDHITLTQPLQVSLNQTSLVTIVPMQQNYLMIGNNFTDVGWGVQFYGTALQSVIADNTSTRGGGFVVRGLNYHHIQPSWYNQLLDNKILEGSYFGLDHGRVISGHSQLGVTGIHMPMDTPAICRGIVIRANTLENNASIVVQGGKNTAKPSIKDVIVEKNTVRNSDRALQLDKGILNVWQQDNNVSPEKVRD